VGDTTEKERNVFNSMGVRKSKGRWALTSAIQVVSEKENMKSVIKGSFSIDGSWNPDTLVNRVAVLRKKSRGGIPGFKMT